MNFDWASKKEWCACTIWKTKIECKCGYDNEQSAREFCEWWNTDDMSVLVPVNKNFPEWIKKRQLAGHFEKKIEVDFIPPK